MQTTSLRTWSQITDSISYDYKRKNLYTSVVNKLEVMWIELKIKQALICKHI